MTVSLKDVGSGFKRTAINENFETIETQLNDEVLQKDGSQPLEANLDFNSNRGINAADAVFDTDLVPLGQLHQEIVDNAAGLVLTAKETQLGSSLVGSVSTFTSVSYTVGAGNLIVYRNGVYQNVGIDYVETTNVSITWISSSLPNSTDLLTFLSNVSTAIVVPSSDSYLIERQDGSDAVAKVFTLVVIAYTADGLHLEVYKNGLLLDTVTDYTETSPTTITLVDTPNGSDKFKFRIAGV